MGVTTLYYLDAQTNRVAPFQRKDMCEAVRLGNGLEHFDVISTIGIPQDVPPHLVDFYSILDMVANTEKPLIVLVSEDSAFPPVLDLLEGLFPRAVSSPFILPYFNPITPLVMNASTTDKMLVAMDRGLGFIFSNYGMVGVSTPITLFETISLLNAELLAALTFSQLAHEGAPIILGSMPAFFDMRTMVSFYEPKTMMLNLACAELMSHYGIPHCGTSGSTTGWGPDVQAAGEQMLNQVSSLMGKAGLAPFVGSVLGGKVFSPENAVLADEIIAKARRFADGFVMERDPTVWGELLHAEPGASFLSAEATLQQFRTAYRESVIFPRWSFEAWQDRGSPGSRGQLRTHTLHLLETLAPPEDCERVTAAGEQLIRDFASHSFI
jgi:trimethylamine--corrinoid protein Co-methyltransferase